MSLPFEVAIVSAFGRGELLAGELKTRGFHVALVDLTKALGERSFPDQEGPFPVARPNPLLPAHLEWLMSHSFDEIPNGFSLWLKEGPLDFRGPLSEFCHSRVPAMRFFRDHHAGWVQGGANRPEMVRKAGELKFEDAWLIQLAHSFAGTELRPSAECHLVGEPFPMNQAIQLPIFTPLSLQRSRQDAEQAGVVFINADGVTDIRVEGSRLVEFAVSGAEQALRAKSFVWCLSSEETASISKKLARAMFPRGILLADWAWRRFTIHSAKNSLEAIVPAYVVMMDDMYFPWAYDNLIVLKRRKSGLTDLWARLPAEASKRPEQFQRFITKLESHLNTRFPKWSHEIEPPWDENPPLYPVFDPEKLAGFAKNALSNVFYEGAEFLPRLDWAGRFQKQTETMLRLQILKQQEMAKTKDRSDDSALHAP